MLMNTPNSTNQDSPFTTATKESPGPAGIDRRSFLVRNAVIGAAAVMTGKAWTPEARAAQAEKEAGAPKLGSKLSPDLDVVKKSKGRTRTVPTECTRGGPGLRSPPRSGPRGTPTDFNSASA